MEEASIRGNFPPMTVNSGDERPSENGKSFLQDFVVGSMRPT
jgi:hypothetical protein